MLYTQQVWTNLYTIIHDSSAQWEASTTLLKLSSSPKFVKKTSGFWLTILASVKPLIIKVKVRNSVLQQGDLSVAENVNLEILEMDTIRMENG